jgi:DNA-binding CsgD family transcriptional regulator
MTQTWAQPGTPPTARELVVARAVIESDSMQEAARTLGINERSLRLHLANLRIRLRARHNAELFYRLRDHLVA